MTSTITLTKKEVEEARRCLVAVPCPSFIQYSENMQCRYHAKNTEGCRLCKKLTEFATVHCPKIGKEGEDE